MNEPTWERAPQPDFRPEYIERETEARFERALTDAERMPSRPPLRPRHPEHPGALDDVLRPATMAAHGAFLDHRDGVNADRVRVAVRAAFECALGNGLIQITDPAGWPKWLSLDPPYVPHLPGVTP